MRYLNLAFQFKYIPLFESLIKEAYSFVRSFLQGWQSSGLLSDEEFIMGQAMDQRWIEDRVIVL